MYAKAFRAITDEICDVAFWLLDKNCKISVRTDDGEIFKAERIRESTHYPYIVPELVNGNDEMILITYLTFGSALRLLNVLREKHRAQGA